MVVVWFVSQKYPFHFTFNSHSFYVDLGNNKPFMIRLLILAVLSVVFLSACSDVGNLKDLVTPFEISDSLETATYPEAISWWRSLEKESPYVCVKEFGETDAGLPLHIVFINTSRNFNHESIKNSGKTLWLINNGIHPGEPDGIDASMLYAREILSRENFESEFNDLVIMIIPIYNVGGSLNRNCCSRANQNGPESYGFRGNARNLDLNRDFSKADSENARSFIKLFSKWNPDVYLETHVSNGADYPYTMTYLLSHPDKLTPPLNTYLSETISESLKSKMKGKGDEMIPYVNVFGTTPDSGFASFYDTPRYSTGFTALHNSIGLLTETHMLKPFKQRVVSTLNFLNSLGETLVEEGSHVKQAREDANIYLSKQQEFTIDWEIDDSQVELLDFKGYEAFYDTSEVTGELQLYYDRSKQWEKQIPYLAHLKAKTIVSAPSYYLVPSSWDQVVQRLELNAVEMKLIDQDTIIAFSAYQIIDFESSSTPYESHYYHSNVEVEKSSVKREIRANSYYLISTNQLKRRLLVEMLEPKGPDSYFNWNFYDEILQQKEWFSSYVFDPEASEMVKDPEILKALEDFVSKDSSKRDNPRAKLGFLYTQSSHYESDRHMIYPVYRIE